MGCRGVGAHESDVGNSHLTHFMIVRSVRLNVTIHVTLRVHLNLDLSDFLSRQLGHTPLIAEVPEPRMLPIDLDVTRQRLAVL